MLEKLNEKDKNTLKMGGIGAIVLVVLVIAYQGFNQRAQKLKELKRLELTYKSLDVSENVHKRIMAAVPIFQMPGNEQNQKTYFRNSLNQKFEQLGITTAPWQEVAGGKTHIPPQGYGVLLLRTSGSCRFDNILTLLADLKENPYYVGVEELNIQCDPQNPQQATFIITLSTYTNNRKSS
ncbi:MAG: hypothetical protein JW787_09020 [Sedimentisphaerales bacterium]|nr:hypothetical protein [Sedimentisphaerales bacterium]